MCVCVCVWKCSGCNGYPRRKGQGEMSSNPWTRLFSFHIAVMSFRNCINTTIFHLAMGKIVGEREKERQCVREREREREREFCLVSWHNDYRRLLLSNSFLYI